MYRVHQCQLGDRKCSNDLAVTDFTTDIWRTVAYSDTPLAISCLPDSTLQGEIVQLFPSILNLETNGYPPWSIFLVLTLPQNKY